MIIDKEKIIEAKKKLGIRNADLMAELLQVKNWDDKNKKGICPFHSEDTPSFIYNAKNFCMKCFGCGCSMDLIDAYMKTQKSTYIDAVEYLFNQAGIQFNLGEKGVQTKRQYRYPKPENITGKEKVYEYLALRKISKETIDYADVRQDKHGNIVFNFYDTNDVLTTVKYRPSRRLDKGETKTWCQTNADTSHLLFNMNRINTSKPLAICEGEIDALAGIEAGYTNIVSVPFGANNYQWIEENFDWLEQFENIIIIADNDHAGIKMQKEASFRLGSWRTKIVDIPQFHTENQVTYPMKDLNEVLYRQGKQAVLDLIHNAKDTPVDSVVNAKDIKDIDFDQMGGITTGSKQLDSKLMKHFYGTLTLLTGIEGHGKSTLLGKMICGALDSGNKTWLFSGELPNSMTRMWLSQIFAGQRNVKRYEFNGKPVYKLTQEAKKNIWEHYDNDLYIYKDGLSTKIDFLLRSMEASVRKYGTKFLVLDNMMTIDLDETDRDANIKQKKLVADLIAFAKRYDVAILLVLHPHKMDTVRHMNSMDVQGAKAITNLAHRTLVLYRVSQKEKEGTKKLNGDGWYREPIPYDAVCEVIKDRFFGARAQVGFYYDEPSRRLYTDLNDLDVQYGWDKTKYTTPLPYPPQDLLKENEVFGECK